MVRRALGAHHVGRGRGGRVDRVADGDVVDPVGRGSDQLGEEHGAAVDELGELVHLRAHARVEQVLDPLRRVFNLALQLHLQDGMREVGVLAGAKKKALIASPVLRDGAARGHARSVSKPGDQSAFSLPSTSPKYGPARTILVTCGTEQARGNLA